MHSNNTVDVSALLLHRCSYQVSICRNNNNNHQFSGIGMMISADCNEYTLWCQPHLWHTCTNFYIKSSCTMCLYSYVYIPKDLLPCTGSLSYCMKNNNRVYVYGKSKYLYFPGECWVSMTVWNSCQKHYIWQQAAATETSLRGRHLAAAHWLPALILGTYMIL